MKSGLTQPGDSSASRTPIQSEHSDEPLSAGEAARIWQTRGVTGLELLHGKYRTFSFARHFHEAFAIGVVETGVMRTYCQGRVHRVPAGNVILLNPGDIHAPQPGVALGWSFRMFYLDDALMRDVLGGGTPPGFAKPFVEDWALYSSLLRLHQRFERDPELLEAESLLVHGVMAIASRLPRTRTPKFRDPGPAKVDRARDYLQAHCAESVALRDLSFVTGLSPYHLVRSFRAQVGLTPHAFLLQSRIDRGRKLLSSGASIAEVALQIGFADQSHFTRQFKRFTGVTPAKYLCRVTGLKTPQSGSGRRSGQAKALDYLAEPFATARQ